MMSHLPPQPQPRPVYAMARAKPAAEWPIKVPIGLPPSARVVLDDGDRWQSPHFPRPLLLPQTGRQYPLAVKLCTISARGADVYSYAEDSMVIDPKLGEHLAHWGINMLQMEKSGPQGSMSQPQAPSALRHCLGPGCP